MPSAEGIYARPNDYLDRYIQIGVASERVISVSFQTSADATTDAHPLLDRIEAYLEGVEDDFTDVEVAFTLGGDDRAVLEALRGVPYGEEIGVETLVSMTPGLNPEDPDDAERVRQILDENPTPLLVPDHRVRDGPSALEPVVEQRLRSLEGL